ncbi:sugar O-acetyltransferase [Candidatus Protochlamydia phocaeensis]|uniref:sugar O-acetyltransferase n=1 Tax=Candidatus Protochlamydia phocaeensis TaxID=1414722 RepID=UPI0008381D5E|nr:sugar O-acetyltransferase [Candidatus Protochlamydia phocaeensis]
MKTELEKMLNGELYNAYDPQLVGLRAKARTLLSQYNLIPYEQMEERKVFLKQLLGSFKDKIDIQAPFYCDYGCNIFAGENLYANFNCVILDCAKVTLGDNVLLGPNVQLYAGFHPLLASERLKGLELALPVNIGNNVWIGGGAIVCPGVTIGDNTTIGAGSVVVKDIPANVIAAGNPCRVMRELDNS